MKRLQNRSLTIGIALLFLFNCKNEIANTKTYGITEALKQENVKSRARELFPTFQDFVETAKGFKNPQHEIEIDFDSYMEQEFRFLADQMEILTLNTSWKTQKFTDLQKTDLETVQLDIERERNLASVDTSILDRYIKLDIENLYHLIMVILFPQYTPVSNNILINSISRFSKSNRKSAEEIFSSFSQNLTVPGSDIAREKKQLYQLVRDTYLKDPKSLKNWFNVIRNAMIKLVEVRDLKNENQANLKFNFIGTTTALVIIAITYLSAGTALAYVNSMPLSDIVAKYLDRNANSIACMAAYTAEKPSLTRRTHYPDKLWNLSNYFGWISSKTPGPFCYILKGISSEYGELPIRLQEVPENPEPQLNECNYGYEELDKFIVQQVPKAAPLEIFIKAMEIMNHDTVRALSLIALVTWTHSQVRNRHDDKLLNNLSTVVSDNVDDFHGQFYHWWGHFSLTYTFVDNLAEFTIFRSSSRLYEYVTDDLQDITVDDTGDFAGALYGCLSYMYKVERAVSGSWWNDLSCKSIKSHNGYILPQKNFSIFQEFITSRNIHKNSPYCNKF